MHLLDAARAEFASAQSDLSSPLFTPMTIVPVIGRQFRSVRALSAAAGTVSEVGATFLTQVHAVLDQPHTAGPDRVAVPAAALDHRRIGPAVSWPASTPGRRRPWWRRWPRSTTSSWPSSTTPACDWPRPPGCPRAVASILQGPQTYVVLASNNAEMRSGSGAFLDVGVATTSDGSVQLGDLSPSGDRTLPGRRGAGDR